MIASLFLASALALTGVPVKPVAPPSAGQINDQKRLETCVDLIKTDPENAYEQAMAWGAETHTLEAKRCAGLAMVGRGDPIAGAGRLEALAKETKDGAVKGEIYVEAGNAWIVAGQPTNAINDFNIALKIVPDAPDVLIDRGRAYIMLANWRAGEEDLSAALDHRPKDWYALTLRAQTRLKQGVFDLAIKDAEAALKIDPKNDAALEVRGAAIDGQRLAKAGAAPQN